MYNVLGIVAEYNPFHNGHIYHLKESLIKSRANYTVAVISGNFTQRGDTSIINKWTKAEIAILNGIDLVIELPTIYSISSAENFAEGAIKILDSLKVVSTISFGTETFDLDTLEEFAEILNKEPKKYTSILSHELKKGVSFPKARENALLMYLNGGIKYANILSNPNNILAIEYLKAMKKYRSNMIPMCVKRNKVGYNDENINDGFASGTAIRKMILEKKYFSLSQLMPEYSYNVLSNNIKIGQFVPSLEKFEREIIYNLRKMTIDEIANLADVTEGLSILLKNAANSCNTLYELINITKTKRYTETRIKRILLYSLLGITKQDMLSSRKTSPYIRVLGFNDKGKELLSLITYNNPKLDIVTSVKRFTDTNKNKSLQMMLEKDIFATNVYTLEYKNDSWSNLDYTKKIVII